MSDTEQTFYASRLDIGQSVPISDKPGIGSAEVCKIQFEQSTAIGQIHAQLKIAGNTVTVTHHTKTPSKTTIIADANGKELQTLSVAGETTAVVAVGQRLRIGTHEILITSEPLNVQRGEQSHLNLHLLDEQGDEAPAHSSRHLASSNDRGTRGQTDLFVQAANAAHKGKDFPESAAHALKVVTEHLPQAQRGAVLLITEQGLESVADWSQSEEGNQSVTISRSLLKQAATGEAVISEDAGADGEARSLLDLSGTSVMLIPILGGNGGKNTSDPNIIGYVQLEASTEQPFTEKDLALGHTLSTILGATFHEFEAADLRSEVANVERGLALAGVMQMNVIGMPAQVDGYAAEQLYRQSESTSGDWTLSEVAPNGNLIRILGDIAGHGDSVSQAATSMTILGRHMVKSGAKPPEIMAALNARLHEDFGDGKFSTCLIYSIKPTTNEIQRYSAAGLVGFIVDSNGNVRKIEGGSDGMPIGIVDSKTLLPMIEPRTIDLKPGEMIIDMTDGIPETFREVGEEDDENEAYDTQFFESGRVEASITRARTSAPGESSSEIAQHVAVQIVHDAKEFQGDSPAEPYDDVTIMTTMRNKNHVVTLFNRIFRVPKWLSNITSRFKKSAYY